MKKSCFGCLSTFTLVLACLLLSSHVHAQQTVVAGNPGKLVSDTWEAVNTGYFDATFGGLNWQAVGEAFLRRDYANIAAAHAAIHQMLARLNSPATRLLNKAQFEAFRAELGGQAHVGTGLLELGVVDIGEAARKLLIVTTLADTPARRAGLQPGDVIEAINGAATVGLGLTAAMEKIRGPAGAVLTLSLNRGGRRFEVKLVNERLAAIERSVFGEVRQISGRRLGYVRHELFLETSVEQMRAALQRLEQQRVSGLILDLRHNPGGDLRACMQLAGLFLGAAPFVNVKTHTGLRPFNTQGAQITKLPLVVLVNKGTASAAEALAAALRTNQRARLVGQTTGGKGLIHNVLMLGDGSAVLLPLGSMQTMAGDEIWQRGLTPDFIVNPLAMGDAQFEKAVELLLPQQSKRKPTPKR